MTTTLQKNRFMLNLKKMDTQIDNVKKAGAKTIILLGSKSLLGHSVEILLSMEKTWQVVRISNKQSFIKLLQTMKEVSPSVVILYQAQQAGNARLLISLLRDCPGLKVITVNPDDNVMEVYAKQTLWLREVNDLLATVED